MSHSSEHLFERDLDAVLDHAFAHLDEMLDLEEGLENEIGSAKSVIFDTAPAHYEPGGLVHRFSDDTSIRVFCAENYLEAPRISAQGQVTAWCDYTHERVHIGWTN